ncbi:hypothetical protein JCM3770_005457 [Rhodotorula araucariae]
MQTTLKQATLQFSPSGQVAVSHVEARPTSRSPSPSLGFRRQPLREAYVDPTKPRKDQDGALTDGEEVSADDEDVALEPVVCDQSIDMTGQSTDSGDTPAPPAVRPAVKPAASASKPSSRRERSASVFDGVIIYTGGKSRRPATAKPGPSRPSKPSALREAVGTENGATSASDDAPIRPSRRAGKSTTKGRGKKRVAPPSLSSSSSPSDQEDLPVPASIAADNARLAMKREQRLQDAALRSGGKGGKKKARVDTKRKLAALSQGRRDRRSADEESEGDFIVDDGVIQYDSTEDGDGAPVRKRRDEKGKGRARDGDDDDEEASDDSVRRSLPKKKKKKKGGEGGGEKEKSRKEVQRELLAVDSDDEDVGPSRRHQKVSAPSSKGKEDRKGKVQAKEPHKKRRRVRSSEDEGDDEPDDLEILDEVTIREEKFRARQDKSSRFAQLKAAREQRAAAKNKVVVLDSEDETPPPRSLRMRTGTSAGTNPRAHRSSPRYLGAEEDESSESESSSVTDSRSVAEQTDWSENLDGFIVEGEPDAEGAAEVDKLRESIREQSQGLRFYVKQYLAYLVYLILDPDCDWLGVNEEWKIAHQRVHTHLRDLLNSLVSSSAWKPKFRHAVDTRPDWTLDELAPEDRGGACDACMMGRQRHCTFIATVSGRKYDPKTLRPIPAADDSSESGSVDSEEDDDDEGRPAKEKVYEFHLGVSCAGRAEVYHQLKHWAYDTRQRLLDKLADRRRAVEPARRAPGMSRDERRRERARRRDEAGRLVEVLERDLVMGSFASKLVDEIEKAQTAFANAK